MQTHQFAKILADNHAAGYLVGGAVRDKQLGLTPKDHDYCVTGLDQSTFESLFPSAELQGKDFPVYRMQINNEFCEVALARSERKVGTGHKGFEIHANPSVTIEDDLSRRDLTMNSMAECLHTGALIDPFGGEIDLQNGLLRATTQAFAEDPLRVYRTARFAAKFGFGIDFATLIIMKSLKDELSSLSIERVAEETKKALLSDHPSNFFRELALAGLLDVHFPEIADLVGLEQNREFHPEGSVFEHTMQVLDATRLLINDFPVHEPYATMVSALLHDVGKKPTFKLHPVTGKPTFHSHEQEGVAIAQAFLKRFKIPSVKHIVLFNVANHMVMHGAFTDMKVSKAVDFVNGKFEKAETGFIKKPGVLSSMRHPVFVNICMADVAGRLSDADSLPAVVRILVNTLNANQTDVFDEIHAVIPSENEARRLAADFATVIRHVRILNDYVASAESIACQQDIAELAVRFTGEALGHAVHQDKKRQRIAVMKTARSQNT